MAPWRKSSEDKKGSKGKAAPVEETTIFRERLKRMYDPLPVDATPRSPYTKAVPSSKPADVAADQKLRKQAEKSGMFKFLLKSEERTAREAEQARQMNNSPLRKEDTKLWRSLPPVPDPWGGPALVRRAISSPEEASSKVLQFMQNFQFGLWGFRQRPFPPEKPFDVQQALGFKFLNRRYYDFAMKSGGWYYKDRMGRTRGPCELIQMRTAWAAGIVDKNTFVWGEDMDEFAPIGMVYGLKDAVAPPDVELAALGTKVVHRLARLWNPLRPRKGHEARTFADLQKAALARRDHDTNVLRNSGGVWPGERSPSHVVGLWATGSQLTKWLEENPKKFPEKFVTYEMRKELAKQIPGLRPWEVLDMEQVWDLATFNGEFYRAPLGTRTAPLEFQVAHEEEKRDQQMMGQGVDD
eukprot:TRINITY_DN4149_c0_g1_i1.p1 TRINITY_DN4149_c0_g1~~TRINITY_DN4149_c0_g1_i1.p1  ORF type:complete len:410 (-),score=93.76 TRINITY_DN4149_c0_g1_i1:839-2068(-)